MADVRAMLRAERAARAPPSKARKHAAPAPAIQVPASKKRKANTDDDDDEDSDARKRSRPELANDNLPAGFFDERHAAEEDEKAETALEGFIRAQDDEPVVKATQDASRDAVTAAKASTASSVKEQISAQAVQDNVDEDEWAAFQAFTSSVPAKSALDALNSDNAISAAPLTTEQAAAQAREEAQEKGRSKREEEIEDEKEEAADRLEEEFEVMGELEDRIRRLKEKREVLRRASRTSADGARPPAPAVVAPSEAVVEEEDEEDSEEDDVDEFAGWRFGSR